MGEQIHHTHGPEDRRINLPGPQIRRNSTNRSCVAARDGRETGHQLGGEQRVPAEVEEVVVDTEGLVDGQGEHLAPQRREQFLHGVAGRDESVTDAPVQGRGGECDAVEFAVGRQRQRGQRDDRSRHEVIGKGSLAHRPQCIRVEGRPRVAHHVRDEPLVARHVLADHHGGGGDSGLHPQGGADLARLDPDTADLDLVIDPPQELHDPVGAPSSEVAGAVGAALSRSGAAGTGSGTNRSAVSAGRA